MTRTTMQEIYLDNSASTPPLPKVIEVMQQSMTARFGNPSSAHTRGEHARNLVEDARLHVAQLIGTQPSNVVFTSGATESNNTVLRGVASRPGSRIVTLVSEHSSVLSVVNDLETRGVSVVPLSVDEHGLLDLHQLEEALETPTTLLSIHWVNGETGIIQPIEQVCELAQRFRVPLHVDAAQALGKLKIPLDELPISYLSVSGHKIHGPQGVGALYLHPDVSVEPLLHGGPQERGQRAGTENVPGIIGFGEAARLRALTMSAVQNHVRSLRDTFEADLAAAAIGISVNGANSPRVDSITNVRFSKIDGQALVARLDQKGIYCSQSSACTSARPEPSYVLRSMGLTEDEAYSSVRFAFSELNEMTDVKRAVDAIINIVGELRCFEGAGAFAA